jgi:Ca2+-binding RTX toxin-like protein
MVSGGYGFNTMMHEIGHALGLSHPGLYDASSGGVITYDANASFSQDNRQYTMMSYFGGYNTTTNMWVQDGTSLSYKYSQTPMVYDIAAIQSLYGADTTTRTGDTIYGYHNNFAANDTEKAIFDFSINTIPLCTIWDAGGSNDTLDCSGWSGGQVIDLTPGNYSSVRGLSNNVGIAFNTIIEKAIGGIGNDKLVGNSVNNTLDGGAGADTMLGGLGNDTYYVDNTGDVVTENISAGIDVVSSTISYTLTANVENLILTGTAAINGTGNADANTLTGNSADNILSGQAGNDVLIGGAGADTLVGGLGKDSYNLAETTTATDTVRIATGDSLASMGNYDLISGFKLGAGVVSTAGVDKLDLVSTFIATKAVAVNGIDSGVIMSHSINNGIISFDDINNYTAPLTITATHLSSVFSYLQANIKSSNTVGFISEGNTFVFQDAGVIDTLVELVGVVASSISTTGLATNSLWIA